MDWERPQKILPSGAFYTAQKDKIESLPSTIKQELSAITSPAKNEPQVDPTDALPSPQTKTSTDFS